MLKVQENNLFGFEIKKESCKVEIDKCLIECLQNITFSTAHLFLQLSFCIVTYNLYLVRDVGAF